MLKRLALVSAALVAVYTLGYYNGAKSADARLRKANDAHLAAQQKLHNDYEVKLYESHQDAIIIANSNHELGIIADGLRNEVRSKERLAAQAAAELSTEKNQCWRVLDSCVTAYERMANDAESVAGALRDGQRWYEVYGRK